MACHGRSGLAWPGHTAMRRDGHTAGEQHPSLTRDWRVFARMHCRIGKTFVYLTSFYFLLCFLSHVNPLLRSLYLTNAMGYCVLVSQNSAPRYLISFCNFFALNGQHITYLLREYLIVMFRTKRGFNVLLFGSHCFSACASLSLVLFTDATALMVGSFSLPISTLRLSPRFLA
jgi:hypothetical protein